MGAAAIDNFCEISIYSPAQESTTNTAEACGLNV
jgi:hypothetical protein